MIRAMMSASLLSTTGNWKNFLTNSSKNGANTIRFFLDYLDGDLSWFNPIHPFKLVSMWNPYALAGEPGYPDRPIFDLTQKDPGYWDHLQEVLLIMRDLGLIPWVVFTDRCSHSQDGPNRFNNSIYSNIQRYPDWNVPGAYSDGVEAAIPDGYIGLGLNDYRYQWELWFIDLCYSIGITTIYGEPENEFGYEWADSPDDKALQLEWARLRCDALRNLKYNVVISSDRYPIENQTGQFCDTFSRHNIIVPDDIRIHPSPLPPDKTILSGDGGFNGTGPLESVFHNHNRGLDQAQALAFTIVEQGYAGFEELPQEQISDANGPWNTDKISYAPLRELSIGTGWDPPSPPIVYIDVEVCDISHLLPNQYCPRKIVERFEEGKEPKDPCSTHGQIIEKTCYEKYIADRPWTKWQIGEFIRCLFGKKT